MAQRVRRIVPLLAAKSRAPLLAVADTFGRQTVMVIIDQYALGFLLQHHLEFGGRQIAYDVGCSKARNLAIKIQVGWHDWKNGKTENN